MQLAKGNDDNILVVRAAQIFDGIEKLQEPLQYHGTKVLNNMDTNLKIQMKGKNIGEITLKELLNSLENYVQNGEITSIQFRS